MLSELRSLLTGRRLNLTATEHTLPTRQHGNISLALVLVVNKNHLCISVEPEAVIRVRSYVREGAIASNTRIIIPFTT